MISYGEFAGLVCAFLWALNSLIIRTQSLKVPPILMNALRCTTAGLFFWVQLPFSDPVQAYEALSGTEWGLLCGSVLIGVTLGDTLYLWSIREMGVSRTMAMAGTVPLTTLLFEHLLLEVPFPTTFVAGCFLVVGGVLSLSCSANLKSQNANREAGEDEAGTAHSAGREAESERSRDVARAGGSGERVRLGVGLMVGAVVLWGLSTVMLRPAIANLTAVQANSVRMPLVATFLLGIWRVGGRPLTEPLDRRTIAIVCASGLIGMGIGSFFYLEAVKTIGAARTATLASTAPLFAMGMAVAFLREKVTKWVVIGVVLCVGGVWLVL